MSGKKTIRKRTAQDKADEVNAKIQIDLIDIIHKSLEDERLSIQRYLKGYARRAPGDTVMIHEILLIVNQLQVRQNRLKELRAAICDDMVIVPQKDAEWRAVRLWQQTLQLDAKDVFDYPTASPYKELEDIYG